MKSLSIVGACAILLPLVSSAAVADDGRFSLEKVDGGYVRLNTVTGEVSFCEQKGGQFVCRVTPSERQAYETEIRILQERLEQIEERVALLEGKGFESRDLLPSDEEFEKTMDVMERFFRRFMGIVKDFDKELGEKTEPEATPEKT